MRIMGKGNGGKMQLETINVDAIWGVIINFFRVSLYIFDTLVKRNVPTPADVFVLVEERYLIR